VTERSPAPPVAAVDCGTNSTRLLISPGGGVTLDRRMRITRLGAGVDRTGRLAPEAIARTLDVLSEFRQAMDRFGVERSLATATSAVRDASNSREFLAPATDVLGEVPVVLSGQLEGLLSYGGATAELDAEGPYLVLDIGGGSTELVTESPEREAVVVSLDIGCVRVTERFLGSDPPSPDELAEAGHHVRQLVAGAARQHPGFRQARCLVGLAGTVSALGVLALGLDRYDRDAVHHSVITRAGVGQLVSELASAPVAARRLRPGMERDRADVIVGGALILHVAMEELGYDEVLVSESDILDGIVAELLDPTGVLGDQLGAARRAPG